MTLGIEPLGVAGGVSRLRPASSPARIARHRHLRSAVPGAVRGHVPIAARLAFDGRGPRDPDGRVPGTGVRRVSRLHARFAASLPAGEQMGGQGPRVARALDFSISGATSTPGTTPPPGILTAAAKAMSRR